MLHYIKKKKGGPPPPPKKKGYRNGGTVTLPRVQKTRPGPEILVAQGEIKFGGP